jgi:hypothetical protein
MGTLQEVLGLRTVHLEGASVVGRSPTTTLHLTERYVSNQHALIRWKVDHWELRDRSHNGTFLNGERVTRDQPYRLKVGDRVAFGDRTLEWTLTDESAPGVMVVARSGETLPIHGTVLGIPHHDTPEVTVFKDADGSWKLEEGSGAVVALDTGSEFVAAGKTWRFCCPEPGVATMTNELPSEGGAILHFLVSRDEEYVELKLEF